MRRLVAGVALVLLTMGCSDSAGPETHALEAGSYSYNYSYRRPGTFTDAVFTGTMEVLSCDEEDIIVRWDVDGIHAEEEEGFWTSTTAWFGDAFWVPAHTLYGGYLVANSISRGKGKEILCDAGTLVSDDGNLSRVNGTCSIVRGW